MEIIAFDAHKRYTLSLVENQEGRVLTEARIPHSRGAVKQFLKRFTPGSTVAVETIGSWYWIVDEIEEAGMRPALVHARKAKLMMGMIDKTDRLDAHGLNLLQRNGTLPEVWIPPADLRDKRDLGRTRMVFAHMRTKLKNRIHSVLAKYALHDFDAVSDIFGKRNQERLKKHVAELPPQTRFATQCLLNELDSVQGKIDAFEKRMKAVYEKTPEIELLMTIPGVGFLLAVVIANELGDINRFASPASFAAYAGTTPRVHASGGKVRYGPLRPDVNHYLQWAFAEAANSICVNRKRRPGKHMSRLYARIWKRRGHFKAIGAVMRHLAEATYHVMSKQEPYREPKSKAASPRKA
jgi:transposase